MLLFSFGLLILLFILPFSAGFRELRRQEDAAPLFINMDYYKEPRYFAASFKKILLDSLEKCSSEDGIYNIMLSKQEEVEIIDNALITDDNTMKKVYCVKNQLKSGRNVVFEKEVYVRGDAHIGEENQLRALVCDGNIHIHRGVQLSRWLDAEGSIKIEEQCGLGVSVTCAQELSLVKQCSFKRLYGFPIVTGEISTAAVRAHVIREEELGFTEATERNLETIPANSYKDCSLITVHSLTIGDHTVIKGHVKTHGNLITGAYVTIAGNVFAEGDIQLGPHSQVMGTLFTQGSINLQEGVVIGSSGRIKSVIGKKGIILHKGVTVYGYAMTEGEGIVI